MDNKLYAVINTRTGNFEKIDFDSATYMVADKEEAKKAATEYNESMSLPQNRTWTVVTLIFDPEV